MIKHYADVFPKYNRYLLNRNYHKHYNKRSQSINIIITPLGPSRLGYGRMLMIKYYADSINHIIDIF